MRLGYAVQKFSAISSLLEFDDLMEPNKLEGLAEGVRRGDRRKLSRAITIVESARQEDRAKTAALFGKFRVGNHREALRLGISGAPGVGKSTFINRLGTTLADQGSNIAVLAVDPTSERTKGSILGDKTRMADLIGRKNVYVRPTPTGLSLGGVPESAKDTVFLLEQAGFDVVIVETTGVGQSEISVANLTDIFLLLIAPAGGDDLQGVKRGILEFADFIIVNKLDGDLMEAASRTAAEYTSSMKLQAKRKEISSGHPKTLTISAIQNKGVDKVWREISDLADWRKVNEYWTTKRQSQERYWFRREIQSALVAMLERSPKITAMIREMENRISNGAIDRHCAVEQLSMYLRSRRLLD